MHDHRVFRHKGEWWGATVLGGTGVGTGYTPRITQESVFFTCLYDPERKSRTAQIPAGDLNRIDHRSMVGLLEASEEFGSRWEMVGYNQPDREDYFGAKFWDDPHGLRWAFRSEKSVQLGPSGPELIPSVEVACLDDSAIRRSIPLQAWTSFDEARKQLGDADYQALTDAVQSTYDSLDPRWHE